MSIINNSKIILGIYNAKRVFISSKGFIKYFKRVEKSIPMGYFCFTKLFIGVTILKFIFYYLEMVCQSF